MEEIAKELARILLPVPAKADEEDDKEYSARLKAHQKERRDLSARLMAAASASPLEDPVLAKLSELAAAKEAIQREISLVLAYAREFVRPEPYRLKALADATKMSISGVRTAYTAGDVAHLANEIRRRNNKGTVFPGGEGRQSIQRPDEQENGTYSGDQWWKVAKAPAVEDVAAQLASE